MSGYIITVNDFPIVWKSQKQSVIALSSSEAEYIALFSCAKLLSWIRKLFWEVTNVEPWQEGTTMYPTVMRTDSTSAISLATKEQVSARNKHIDLKVHHVRELIKKGTIMLEYTPSSHQRADVLTKIVDYKTLQRLTSYLHLERAFGEH